MPGQVAGVTKCVSANPYRNNRSTIVMGGNVTATDVNAPSLETQLSQQTYYGPQLVAAVSPDSSGNIGTFRPMNAAGFAKFGYFNPDFIMMKNDASIAGSGSSYTGSNLMTAGASDTQTRRPVNRFYAYARYNETAFDVYAGTVTKGSAAGVDVLASGIDGTTGFYADTAIPRPGIPARLTFMAGSITPSGARYSVPKNP